MANPDIPSPATQEDAAGDGDDAPPLLKEMIRDALDACHDASLLDLVYKMLIHEY